MKSALFALLFSVPVYADSGWQVNLYVFSSADGHGLSNSTYLAEFRLPAADEEACNSLGNAGLKYFESGHLSDGAVTLGGFSCEAVP